MRVLVTGGGGFLGAAVADALAARGDQAIAFDTSFALAPPLKPGVERIVADITDPAHVAQVIRQTTPGAVVHCAAIVSVLASLGSPLNVVRVNVEGTINVLEAMRLFGVGRLLHVSSEETYGDFTADRIDEEHPQRPMMPYGASKVAVEHLSRCYRDMHGMEVIHLRTSWVYGPTLPRDRVPKNWIDAALAGRELHIEAGGDSRIDHTYVDDFVAGTLAALDLDRHPHDVYHVASDTAPTLSEVAQAVRDVIPGARVSIGPGVYRHGGRVAIPRKGALDCSRARAAFGYVPRFDIRAGIAAYVDAVRSS
jgi:UDP-glucose 4-epimerase